MSSKELEVLFFKRTGFTCRFFLSDVEIEGGDYRDLQFRLPDLCDLLLTQHRIPCRVLMMNLSLGPWLSTRAERERIVGQFRRLANVIRNTALGVAREVRVKFRHRERRPYGAVPEFAGRMVPEFYRATDLEDDILSLLLDAATSRGETRSLILEQFPGRLPQTLRCLEKNCIHLEKLEIYTEPPTTSHGPHSLIHANPIGFAMNDFVIVMDLIRRNLQSLESLRFLHLMFLDAPDEDVGYQMWTAFRDLVATAPQLVFTTLNRHFWTLWTDDTAPSVFPGIPSLYSLRTTVPLSEMLPMHFGARLTRSRLCHSPGSTSIHAVSDTAWIEILRDFAMDPKALFQLLKMRVPLLLQMKESFVEHEDLLLRNGRRPHSHLADLQRGDVMIYLPTIRNTELYDAHVSYSISGTNITMRLGNGRPIGRPRMRHGEEPLLALHEMKCFRSVKVTLSTAYRTQPFMPTISDRLFRLVRDTVISFGTPNLVKFDFSLSHKMESSDVENSRWAEIIRGLPNTLEKLTVRHVDRNIPEILTAIRITVPTLQKLNLYGPPPHWTEEAVHGASVAFIMSLQRTLKVLAPALVEFLMKDIPIIDTRICGPHEALDRQTSVPGRPFHGTIHPVRSLVPISRVLKGRPDLQNVEVSVLIYDAMSDEWTKVVCDPKDLKTGRVLRRVKEMYFPHGRIEEASHEQWVMALNAVHYDQAAVDWLMKNGMRQFQHVITPGVL